MNTPLADPVVTIPADVWMKATGAFAPSPQTLTLKWSLLFEYYADKWGVPLETLLQEMRKPGAGKLSMMVEMFAALAAHNFLDARAEVPRPERWAAALSDSDMPEISKGVLSVLRKRAGLPERPQEPAQTEQAPQVQ